MRMDFLKNSVIAHRGVYDNQRIYENTIGSIEKCIKENIPVFLDVSLLKDNTIVCFSDKTLMRLIHVEESINNVTLNDLNYYSKIKIPTIEEALVLIRGRVPLIINIRSSSKKHFIESQLLSMLKNYPNENICIQSEDTNVLKYIYKNNKKIRIGYSVSKNNYYKFLLFHSFDYVCLDSLFLSDKQARKLKERYFLVGYNIKTKEQYLRRKGFYDAYVCDNVLDIIENQVYNK